MQLNFIETESFECFGWGFDITREKSDIIKLCGRSRICFYGSFE